MCSSARAEAIAVVAEGRIKDRLKNLKHRLLDQAVRHRGDAKLALTAPWFRYHHATNRLWPVRPPQQAVADIGPASSQHLGGLVYVQPIHSRRSLVGSHLLHGPKKVLSRQNCREQVQPRVVPCPRRGRGFVEAGGPAGFTRLHRLSPGFRHLTRCLAHPWWNFTLSRSALRLGPLARRRLLRPRLTSRSDSTPLPFRA